LREVGSAKERFCFFDMAAECERGRRRKGMQRSLCLRAAIGCLLGLSSNSRECFAIPEVADADDPNVALDGGGRFAADHFGK
jgi:hypothetical protein